MYHLATIETDLELVEILIAELGELGYEAFEETPRLACLRFGRAIQQGRACRIARKLSI